MHESSLAKASLTTQVCDTQLKFSQDFLAPAVTYCRRNFSSMSVFAPVSALTDLDIEASCHSFFKLLNGKQLKHVFQIDPA